MTTATKNPGKAGQTCVWLDNSLGKELDALCGEVGLDRTEVVTIGIRYLAGNGFRDAMQAAKPYIDLTK